ncbi:MAG: nuclear transport factor 2 family protein [Candidatus Acidiferrum sp.]
MNFTAWKANLVGLRLVAAILALVAVSVVLRVRGEGAKSEKQDRAAILAALEAQQAAWNRGDVDAFMEGYWQSPELSFSGTSGITRGFDGVRDRYKTKYATRAQMGELNFSELEFHFLGPDAALVLGHWHLKRESGEIGGVFSLVWQRFPEGWKIVHDHTSQTP